MAGPRPTPRARLAGAALALAAGLTLAACGGGSTANDTTAGASSSSRTETPATAHASPAVTPPSGGTATTPAAPNSAAARSALATCMRKQGIAVPGRGGERLSPPAGVTRTVFDDALRRCGVAVPVPPPTPGGRRITPGGKRASAPRLIALLDLFARCMSRRGFHVKSPGASGVPLFSGRSKETANPKYAAAQRQCFAAVRAGLVRPPGTKSSGSASKNAGAGPNPSVEG